TFRSGNALVFGTEDFVPFDRLEVVISSTTQTTQTTQTTDFPVLHRWLAFVAVIAAAVMDLLDSTIAQVAAPSIRCDLGGSYAVIEWVTASYGLAMAVGLLAGGRLGDLFGRKRVLLVG